MNSPASVSTNLIHVHAEPRIDANKWMHIFEELQISGITRNLLANCVPTSFEDCHLVLTLDETQSSLFNDEHKKRITQSLSRYFNKELQVDILFGVLETESPAQFKQRQREEFASQAIRNFENDKNVQAVVQLFSAQLLKSSITVANEVKP